MVSIERGVGGAPFFVWSRNEQGTNSYSGSFRPPTGFVCLFWHVLLLFPGGIAASVGAAYSFLLEAALLM